jgi:tetratricopeptide (TPR) repeat protein
LLGLPIPDSPQTLRLDGAARADRTADVVLALLENAGESGLLLVLEDLHWFDSASLRVANLVRRRLPSVPLVLTSRPATEEGDELWRGLRSAAEVVPVLPLPEARIMELVALGLGAREVSLEARQFINERADGNPLFAKSLTRELGAAGVLKVVDDVVQLVPAAVRSYERVPRSLDAIIGTRVDRLSPTDSLTLKAASAVGQTFQFEVVRAIHPEHPSRDQLLSSLRALEAERLVVPLAKGDGYAFDHAVTHEVTYTRITPQQREALHAKIAEWHDRARAAESESHHPLLAHHYERAGQTRLACQFLSLAAEQALRSGAFREGARFLERAINLAQRKPDPAITALRRARWHRQLAETLDSLGEKERMGASARLALKELGQTEPKTSVGHVALMVKDAVAQAVALSVNVRVRSRPPEEAFELSRAHLCMSTYYFYAMEPLGMVANTLRATNAAEHTGKSSERARCYAGMSLWLGIVGQQRLAKNYAGRAVKACGDAPDDPGVVSALCVAALFYLGIGAFSEVAECCAAAQQEADPRNDHGWWCVAQAITIWSLVYRGQLQSIEHEISRLRARAKQADSEHLLAWATRFEAHLLLSQGKAAEASVMFREVLAVVKRHGDRAEELLVQSSLVLALVRTEQYEQARELLEATMPLLAGMDRPTSHIILIGLADLVHGLNSLRSAMPADPAFEGYRRRVLAVLEKYQQSFPLGEARVRHFVGQEALSRGDRAAATAAFQRGLDVAVKLGLPDEVALLRADLATVT